MGEMTNAELLVAYTIARDAAMASWPHDRSLQQASDDACAAVLARMVEPASVPAPTTMQLEWRDTPSGERRRLYFGGLVLGGVGEDRGTEDAPPVGWLGFIMPDDDEGSSTWFGPYGDADAVRAAVEAAHHSRTPVAP